MASLSNSIPKIQFTDAGVTIPAEADVLSAVQADINAAFGGNLSSNLDTPQGQIASSQSAIVGDKNNEIAYLVNQFDPQYASGRFQDALGKLYFLTRKGATATSVQCTVSGVAGTVIPALTLAQDINNNIYASTGSVTIGISGTATAEFQNTVTGPIACAAGALNKVYQAVSGWDAITNADDGTLGSNVESRADFEVRRKNSVTINSNGTVGAIYANVFNVANVIDCYIIENPKNTIENKGSTNYAMKPHSVYVAVVGGTDADIAKAIWKKKDLGCDMNGNTTVQVTDNSGYSYPYPTYDIIFNRPNDLNIKFAINIVNDPSLPSNIVALIKNSVIARFNGTDGTTRERIGASIFSSRYYSAVSGSATNVAIVSIQVGTTTANQAKVDVGIDQRPVLSASNITVTLV